MRIYDFSAVDRILENAADCCNIPAISVIVGLGENILYQKSFGKLSCSECAPLCNLQTRFDLASLTKCMCTGTLILQAVDRGMLDLQDTLHSFWDVPSDKKDITIQHLMTHTAGFHPGLHLWEKSSDSDDALSVILHDDLSYIPGKRQSYCCAGFILLGFLLEKLYQMPLNQLAKQEIFQPLQMNNTDFLPQGDNIASTERQANGELLCGIVHDENARFLGGISGNAGLFAPAGDVARFVQMLWRGGAGHNGRKILSHAVLREAFRNFTPGMTQNRGLSFYLPYHADGFAGELFPEGTIGHTGFTGTSFALDLQSGLYVVLLTNRICPSRQNNSITRLRRVVHNAIYAAVDP